MARSSQAFDQWAFKIADDFTERCLPGVFGYVRHWVKDADLAEELTLNALKKALPECDGRLRDQDFVTARVFSAARSMVGEQLRKGYCKAPYDCLSLQEHELMALKFGAGVDNGTITKVLGLSEPEVMAKLRGALETLAAPEKPGEIHMK